MKNKNLQIGTLCTIREGRTGEPALVAQDCKGYWVVTTLPDGSTQDGIALDASGHLYVRAFSLTHQHHYWWKPDDLIPVVNSGG